MTQLAYLPITNTSTNKPTNNYAFLEHCFPELYRVSQEVDQYYSSDHACCLLKARLFVELWCHEVGDKFNLHLPANTDLADKIKMIAASKQVPPYIIDELNRLRLEGNKSAHITQQFDGQWSSNSTLGKTKLKSLMKGMFELAQYLAFKLNHQTENVDSVWQEPVHAEMAEHVYASLSGNKDATFALAERASLSMDLAVKQSELSGVEKKEYQQMLQRDLSYWLEKAHRQGHKETWLMYANIYLKKQLILPEGQSIDNCFKEALKSDDDGEATYQFGVYLVKHSQHKRGIAFITQAAEMQHHQAIRDLQQYNYQKDEKHYLYWINAGIEAKEKRSFTLDLGYKLAQWELDVENELLKKKARSALISAESRQSEGVLYYRGYCNYHGYWGKTPNTESGLKTMIEHYNSVPEFVAFEAQLFNLLKTEEEYIDNALDIASKALLACKSAATQAQMKFDLAMLVWKKLQTSKRAKSPYGIKKLLRESAKEGCTEAIQFVQSPKGKALLRDGSLVCISNSKKSIDRKKLKQAKKSARKAKQK
jgi:desulfoferrodoxin (superoxide reductase-like protein)